MSQDYKTNNLGSSEYFARQNGPMEDSEEEHDEEPQPQGRHGGLCNCPECP